MTIEPERRERTIPTPAPPSYDARVTSSRFDLGEPFLLTATAVVDGVEFTVTHDVNNIRVMAEKLIAEILEAAVEDYTFEVRMLTSKGRMVQRHVKARV